MIIDSSTSKADLRTLGDDSTRHWKALERALKARRDALRTRLETEKDGDECRRLQGQAQAIKDILKLPGDARVKLQAKESDE